MIKTILAIIAAIAALALAAFFGAQWLGERKMQRRVDVRVVPVAYAKPDPRVLELGKYLFESRGCAECHGADGRGRVFIDSPGGMFVRSPDITPARLGAYTEADWVRAVRHGVDPKGRALFIMPSEDYNRMNDADFAALVAYVRSLAPGRGAAAEIRVPGIVKALYGVGLVKDSSERIDHNLPPSAPVPVGPTVEHGRYVASMCMGCHGERFSGGKIPGSPPDWPPASNLTPGEASVMPRYPDADTFIAMMRTGKRPDGSEVSKVMPFATLGAINDTDLRAIHAFLKTLPARKVGGE
jgi:mono/diheme cytochrome c family protein